MTAESPPDTFDESNEAEHKDWSAGILRSASLLAASRVIERLGSFVVALLITRDLGAKGLGTYATATAYFMLISTAGEFGSTNLLIREIARDKSKTSSYLIHGSILAGVISLFATGVVIAVVPHLGYSHELVVGLVVMAIAILPGVMNTVQEAVFIAHQRLEYEAIPKLIVTVLTVAASAFLLAQGHGIVSLIVLFVATECAMTVVYYIIINMKIARLSLEFDWAFARSLISDVKAFAGSSVIAAIFSRPEIVILSLLVTETQVGYYVAALKIVDLWQFLPQTYMVSVYPVLSRSYYRRDGLHERIERSTLAFLLTIAVPISVGTVCVATAMIQQLYGSGFGETAALLRILGFNVVLYCVHSVFWRALAARGDQVAVLRIQLISVAIRLVMSVALIAAFGAVGAALSVPLSLLFYTFLLGRAVRDDGTRVHVLRVSRWFILASVAMGAAVLVLQRSLALPATIALGAAIYCLILFACLHRDTATAETIREAIRGRTAAA